MKKYSTRLIRLSLLLSVSMHAQAGALYRVVDQPNPSDPSEVASVSVALVQACRIPIETSGDRHVIQMDKTSVDIIKKDFMISVNCPIELRKGQGIGEIEFANRSREGVSSLMINAPFIVQEITFRAKFSDLLVQFGSLNGEPPLAWLATRSVFDRILLQGRNLTSLLVNNYRYPLTIKDLLPQEGADRKGVWFSVLNNRSELIIDGGRIGGLISNHHQGEHVFSYSTGIRLLDVQILGSLEIQSSQVYLRAPVISGSVSVSSIGSVDLPFPVPGMLPTLQTRAHFDRPTFKRFLNPESEFSASTLTIEGNAKVKLEAASFESPASGNEEFLVIDNSENGGGIVDDPLGGSVGLTNKNVSSTVDYSGDGCADYPVSEEPSDECEQEGHAPPIW